MKKTREQVDRLWWWEQSGKDVKEIVAACDACQRSAGKGKKQEAPLAPIIANRPWEIVTMDFLSGLWPSAPDGWKGCAVVCDRFSRMMHARECATHPTAKEAASLFIGMVIRAHGVPNTIITDRGTQFESRLWFEIMELMGTRVALASTHHPQTNGLTERMNRTLLAMIRKTCQEAKSTWVEALPLLEFAYNNSVHRATGVAPFEVCQGNRPIVPAALLIPEASSASSPSSFAAATKERLQRLQQIVEKADEKERHEIKQREDKRRGNPIFEVGDEVLCRQFPSSSDGRLSKQDFTYHGPYKVAQLMAQGAALRLVGLPMGMPTTINVEYLRKYHRHPTAALASQQEVPPPPELSSTGQMEWEVEAILDQRTQRGRKEYLIKWKGYPQPTWQPARDLAQCADLLQEFQQTQASTSRP